jgi:hypothetical protein
MLLRVCRVSARCSTRSLGDDSRGAMRGRHSLSVRATDISGAVQPSSQPWNLQGMGNNMVQRVEVLVE